MLSFFLTGGAREAGEGTEKEKTFRKQGLRAKKAETSRFSGGARAGASVIGAGRIFGKRRRRRKSNK